MTRHQTVYCVLCTQCEEVNALGKVCVFTAPPFIFPVCSTSPTNLIVCLINTLCDQK
jgi:hypothetical protein